MRHETRDLPGGISMSRCLNVSASLLSLVSGLPLAPFSPHPRTTMQVSGEATMPWQAAMHTP